MVRFFRSEYVAIATRAAWPVSIRGGLLMPSFDHEISDGQSAAEHSRAVHGLRIRSGEQNRGRRLQGNSACRSNAKSSGDGFRFRRFMALHYFPGQRDILCVAMSDHEESVRLQFHLVFQDILPGNAQCG